MRVIFQSRLGNKTKIHTVYCSLSILPAENIPCSNQGFILAYSHFSVHSQENVMFWKLRQCKDTSQNLNLKKKMFTGNFHIKIIVKTAQKTIFPTINLNK